MLSEPEVLEFTLNETHRFVVLGSDGIWEFVSNDEAMRIVIPYYEKNQCELAAEALK